ncbi:hypothetical protein DINM_003417 [Dirofilaria immitis]|nr:hypothetical protein [Dirofilaria immitis]
MISTTTNIGRKESPHCLEEIRHAATRRCGVGCHQSINHVGLGGVAGGQTAPFSVSLVKSEEEAEKRKGIRGVAWNSGKSRRVKSSGGITGKGVKKQVKGSSLTNHGKHRHY